MRHRAGRMEHRPRTTLGDAKAVVIKGHGIVTVGKDIDEVCMNTVNLERTAKIHGLDHTLGFTAPSQEFLDDMMESGRRLGAVPGSAEHLAARGGCSNEWTHYKHKLVQGQRWNRGWS
jgi:ribulose-5-phosphate 4-epimerase/fuculose-1-phosphate aldolase